LFGTCNTSDGLFFREPLPSIAAVNAQSDHEAVATLRVLFEAAPVLEQYVASLRPWTSYEDVIDRSQAFVEDLLRRERLTDVLSIVNAHPAIGADPAKLSADSKVEQGAAGDPNVLARLAELNRQYEAKFGFRFVVFVNGRPKDVILGVLEARMNNSPREEMETAARAMMDIARDRLRKRRQQKL
jgi:2-oxo-4-hydroxy-4-carboxy--5-ureidoimidazoline (OHCU) decarboxylase